MVEYMNNSNNNNYGFTLIEIIFALAIFGILTLSIYTMMTTTINIYNKSRLQYNSTLLAQKYYENIKASSEIDTGIDVYEEGEYTVTVEISEISKYNGKLYRIIIEVKLGENVLETIEGFKKKS